MGPLTFPSSVPLIGQPCTVFEAQIVVPVLCNCHDDNVVFLMTSIDQAKVCGRCGKGFVLTAAEYARGKTAGVQVSVSLIARGPADPSPSSEN